MADDVTPVRQQYLEAKRQYPNALLFFRLGDFYETFDEDAEIVSRELDIVLTSRPIGKGQRAPLAGIPYHAIDNYLSRLIEKGYHVAIAEQMGDQPAKGIFPRKVVRVVTPGTIMETGLLPGDHNNYLSAVVLESAPDYKAGVAYVDITTGEFATTEIDVKDLSSLRAELARLHPAEIIHPDTHTIGDGIPSHITPWPAWRFELGRTKEVLLAHFKTSTLDGYGLKGLPLATRAAGGILQYLKETEPASLNLITGLCTYSLGDYMILDAATRRNLELTETLHAEKKGSLLGVLDQTVTPMGGRLLIQWVSQPLLDIDRIRHRQDGVELLVAQPMLRVELRAALKPLGDLERLTNRVMAGRSQPRELDQIRTILSKLPEIAQLLQKTSTAQDQGIKSGNNSLPYINICSDELSLLQSSLAEDPPATLQNTGMIRSGYSAELDGIVDASRNAREWINNLETSERSRTGIKTLKVGYNKVFGYYIEISKAQATNAPPEYLRKQTLVNAERYITPEMKEYEILVLNAEEQIHAIEVRIFREICTALANSSARILKTARALAEIDVLSALAETAATSNFIRPQILDEDAIVIRDGRHPVVEQKLNSERYIPNDIIFEKGEIIRVITGPNMSGKSTYLRQAALIVLMAQMGSFVPASATSIGIVDRIFTRIGAQDEIHAGQSTFMVEMIETANILHHATSRSLLVLDEIGRGTSTYDGVSIAWAVVEYIHNHPQLRAKTLFATHYHELTQLSNILPGIRNYNVAVTESDGKVVFLHKIVPGGADRSYGIHVAQLAGLPRQVVQRAAEIMSELEKTSGKAVCINPYAAQQAALFPESSPLIDELGRLDVNNLSPIDALNKLFEWQKIFTEKKPEN